VFGETGKGPNARGATRGHIIDGVKASLKRLQLDHVDLYQIHGFDPATPIEETVRALDSWCATASCATSASPTGRPGRS
jgi:aryl-alcohol dehydrogenase-like predicted oxidoreductase